MAKTRIIYQSVGLFVAPDAGPATGSHAGAVKQFNRVQNINWSANIAKTDVNELGRLAAIDRPIIEPPTVSMDFSYFPTNGWNESIAGFDVTGASSAITKIIDTVPATAEGEKNYFIVVGKEGSDLVGFDLAANATNVGVISIGNGFITNYSFEAAVGQFPTATINIEALNIKFNTGYAAIDIPAVDSSSGLPASGTFTIPTGITNPAAGNGTGISALRPGDVVLTIPTGASLGSGTVGTTQVHIQSVSLDVPMSREPINKLGSKFPFSREITFPINVTMSVSALARDIQEGRNLATYITADHADDLAVTITAPGSATEALKFELRNATLESENYSQAIGSNGTVEFNWSGQLGGPEDVINGLFITQHA